MFNIFDTTHQGADKKTHYLFQVTRLSSSC